MMLLVRCYNHDRTRVVAGSPVVSIDDDCFYYHSWRSNVVIAFGTLSSCPSTGFALLFSSGTGGASVVHETPGS